jgi:hypothetical protein
MGGKNAPVPSYRRSKEPVNATEAWMMRVNPEWHAKVKQKAKDWGISASQLVRILVEKHLDDADMTILDPPDTSEESIQERMRREGRR